MPSTLAEQHHRAQVIAPQSRQRPSLPPIPTLVFLEPDWGSAGDPTWDEEEVEETTQPLQNLGG
ncbi:hypothetical protein [Streptomyces filamentosus]|uniref:hypothetical protein n=1 Tax=Streptomyces filamentosus TaxID=67294 RepID=UPI0033D8674A